MKTSKPPLNYTLIGMAGVGKTTLGKRLAETINYRFVDTDQLIEATHGCPLQEILDTFIARGNIQGFLDEERRVFRQASPLTNTVISTGGSFCYSPDLLSLNRGLVIHLDLSWECLTARLKTLAQRGFVLLEANLYEEYLARVPRYQAAADVSISCNDKSIEELSEELTEYCLTGHHIPPTTKEIS